MLDEFPPGAAFDPRVRRDARACCSGSTAQKLEREIHDGKPMVALLDKDGRDPVFSPSDIRLAILTLTLDREGQRLGGC